MMSYVDKSRLNKIQSDSKKSSSKCQYQKFYQSEQISSEDYFQFLL